MADNPIVYGSPDKNIKIGDKIFFLEDKKGNLSFSEVVNSKNFNQSSQIIPNLGISSSSFWLRFEIKNTSDEENLVLEIAQPTLDEVDLYSSISENKYSVDKMGEVFHFKKRKYDNPNYIFDLSIPKNQSKTYFIRIKSGEQILLPLTVGTFKTIFKTSHQKDILFGIYCGIIIVMVFYNLFIFFTVQDISYLYYVAHTFFIGITQASLQGYSFQFIYPDNVWLAQHGVVIFSSLIGIIGIAFQKKFLQTSKFVPFLDKLSIIFLIAYSGCIALCLTGFPQLAYQLVLISAGSLSIFMLSVAIVVYRKGYEPAKFFLLAFILLLTGIFIFVLKDMGILPYNIYTNYTMVAGSGIEVILLSFALADKINILKKEKDESQVAVVKALKENERIIKEQNVVLEAKVAERTEALQNSYQELSKTHKNLKDTQSHLVNSEKMASLGQLTAGIAHEINNPINFVTSSITPLKRDINCILEILNKYDELGEGVNISEKLAEINQLKEELEFEYLKEEIEMMLKGITEGASRTSEIVKGLRNFSRLDEDDLKKSDVNQGIQSTTVLLRSAMGSNIKLIEEYGSIPEIECFPGKLNQVFMNIINNSIHAINIKKSKEEEYIHIKTYTEENKAVINIRDTGIGMTPEIKEKIFDPFFTTKNVGEGTGLGMSIVYSIIQSHQGSIIVDSEYGKGAEFIIYLPIKFTKTKPVGLNKEKVA